MNPKCDRPTTVICQMIVLTALVCSCGPAADVLPSTGPALSEPGTAVPDPTVPPTAAPSQTAAARSAINAETAAQPTARPANSTGLSGPYLGQQTPGPAPIRFATSLIMGALHTAPVFMPGGGEVYWSSQESKIYTMRLENGYWTKPATIAFSASMTDYRDPFISPAGNQLFFLSKGKLPNSQLPEKENIWFVERVGQGWGEPQPLPEEVNARDLHWSISAAANGNLYYGIIENDIVDIYLARYVDGQYVQSERLSDSINTKQLEMTPYIAPDESYLIFSRSKDTSSYSKLYISYADQNGDWGEPLLIDRVTDGLCPTVSPDGKYLFFLSSPNGVSWMSTEQLPGRQ